VYHYLFCSQTRSSLAGSGQHGARAGCGCGSLKELGIVLHSKSREVST
jgi:hypothetical protein